MRQGKPFSKKVDVYAFGVMLWEMLARQLPFNCYAPFEIKEKVIAGDRPAVPYVGREQKRDNGNRR